VNVTNIYLDQTLNPQVTALSQDKMKTFGKKKNFVKKFVFGVLQ